MGTRVPFPSESSCETFVMKMRFICKFYMRTRFHEFYRGTEVTMKWPIPFGWAYLVRDQVSSNQDCTKGTLTPADISMERLNCDEVKTAL